jgi:putative transposase
VDKRFFRRLLAGLKFKPGRIITDGLRSYSVAQCEVLPEAKQRTSRYLNIRAKKPAPADATARALDATIQVA